VAASSTTVSCPLIAFLAIGDGPSCRAIPVPYRADSNGAWRSLTVTRVTLTCAHSYAVLGGVAVAALAGPFDLGRGPLEGGADLVGLTHWFMLSPKIRPGTGGTRYREQAFTLSVPGHLHWRRRESGRPPPTSHDAHQLTTATSPAPSDGS
jgi:hypothetical protein